jgi:hypothetical protein
MKNAIPSPLRIGHSFLMLMVLASVTVFSHAPATAQNAPTAEWKAVEEVFGFPPANLPGGVARFNMPRKDLHVMIGDVPVKPGLALGAWAAFHMAGNNDAMIMGDLVVTEAEVGAVMRALQEGGVEIAALHNHLLGETPKLLYLHIGGHGDPVKLATAVRRAVEAIKAPLPTGPSAQETRDIGIDVPAIEKIMGRSGNVSGGVLHFGMPRAEKLTEEGMETPSSMGAGTAINFQPTGDGRAAIAGDLALLGKEVNPVIRVLQENGIAVVALHSHALDDSPRLFYMHFWASDDALKLAKGLKAAVDLTNSAR